MLDNVELTMYMKFQKISMTNCSFSRVCWLYTTQRHKESSAVDTLFFYYFKTIENNKLINFFKYDMLLITKNLSKFEDIFLVQIVYSLFCTLTVIYIPGYLAKY